MIAPEYYTNANNAELKVITPASEPAAMHAIPGQDSLLDAPVQLESLQATPDVFTLIYQYKDQLHRTRAIKVGNNDQSAFYKVVLSSQVCDTLSVCWLQCQDGKWNVLLGTEADPELISALTSALENR